MTFKLSLMHLNLASEGFPRIFYLFFLLIVIVLPIGFYIQRKRTEERWKKGFFPQNMEFTRDSIMEVYICLAGAMLRADREMSKEKLFYLRNYFNRYFADENYDYMESLRFSHDYPIQIKEISRWMRRNFSYSRRLLVMQFLAGLGHIDGFLNSREYKIMMELKKELDISEKDYQSIIGMYEQRKERERKESSRPSVSTKERIIRLSVQILGVSEFASADEIKKAYRSLVKKHHPDRFATESDAQRKMARERFIEIQKAYEALEELGKV